ncbi:DUF5862 family protein [Pragia fontium]|uniref:DUF5862 domain-containing protein n=1 Tax=Pragia fontium DSM 5563 = ATCC 49100 TaxID=1122977 RepID=A0AAJ4W7R3_9GAMM|nr:hypothetical protein [Pragia fontium]SFC02581.1 hypothetical protein SAMN02745723_101193 [Pragia fontium DSM 5563 = ATCC 49100]VEJ54061.1 Uncharacterised protein [Pragia fontium]
MRELQNNEVEMVSGAWTSGITDSIEGFLWGVGDGVTTGIALGGTATASGGLGFGTLAQAVGGLFVGPIVGGIFGGLAGLAFGKDEVKNTLAHYRENIGRGKASGQSII